KVEELEDELDRIARNQLEAAPTLSTLFTRNTELEREVERLRKALADLIGHAKWAAAEFDIHYSHLTRCEAALSNRSTASLKVEGEDSELRYATGLLVSLM